MKTEAIRQAFQRSLRQFCPEHARVSYDLHCDSVAVYMRADVIWGAWWYARSDDASQEALVHRSTDILVRLSGILAIESARLAVMGETANLDN